MKCDSSDNRVLNFYTAINATGAIDAKREKQNRLLSTAKYNINRHVIKRLDSETDTREKKL